MKSLYLAIKAQLELKLSIQLNYIHIWNNQLDNLEDGKEYLWRFPAVFIEFGNEMPTNSIGNNVKIYDPLEIRIHICHEQLDAGDGTYEQNFDVYTLKQNVYKALQLFQTSGSGVFDRQGEEQDYNHTNVYHYVQRYMTSYIDNDLPLPIGGIEMLPPLTTNITGIIH